MLNLDSLKSACDPYSIGLLEDGKISRLSVIDLPETEDKQDDIDIQTLRELMTPRDKGIDIHHHLR